MSHEAGSEEITARLTELPALIYKREIRANLLSKKCSEAEAEYDRLFASTYQQLRLTVATSTDAKMGAEADPEVSAARTAWILAESRYNAEAVKVRKLDNEFVALRKIASIRNEEIMQTRTSSIPGRRAI